MLIPTVLVRLSNVDISLGIDYSIDRVQEVILDLMVLRLMAMVPLLHGFFKAIK